MEHLEEFHCEKGRHLSMVSVNMLVNNCNSLRAIGDLQKWSGIAPEDLSKFREWVRSENYELDSSSNQRLRNYLNQSRFERKTYINLVAGPALERMRMAER